MSSPSLKQQQQQHLQLSLKQLFMNINTYILSSFSIKQQHHNNNNSNNNNNNQTFANNQITLTQFWYSDRLCVTLDQFQQMLICIGFFLQDHEKNKLIADQVDLITLQDVLEGVQQWKYAEDNVTNYLSSKVNTQKNISNYSNKYHRIKGNSYEDEIGERNMLQNNSARFFSESSSIKPKLNMTQSYLKQHTRRQQSNKFKLANTLKKVKNQSNYQITVKVGQVNDICRKLKNGYSYILDTGTTMTNKNQSEEYNNNTNNVGKSQELNIVECRKDGNQGIITVKIFQRKYQAYKQSIMNMNQQMEGEMEEDLRKVLVEVMCLKSELKQQHMLLERKGVSS